jgi:hypothetical protein
MLVPADRRPKRRLSYGRLPDNIAINILGQMRGENRARRTIEKNQEQPQPPNVEPT